MYILARPQSRSSGFHRAAAAGLQQPAKLKVAESLRAKTCYFPEQRAYVFVAVLAFADLMQLGFRYRRTERGIHRDGLIAVQKNSVR